MSIEGALTGRENVAWFARLYDVPRRERADRVAEALATVELTDAADRHLRRGRPARPARPLTRV